MDGTAIAVIGLTGRMALPNPKPVILAMTRASRSSTNTKATRTVPTATISTTAWRIGPARPVFLHAIRTSPTTSQKPRVAWDATHSKRVRGSGRA